MPGTPIPDIHSAHTAQVRTSDGVIGTSGKATVVFAVTLTGGSDSASAQLHDGTSNAGTIFDFLKATTGTSISRFYGDNGLAFPNGLYADTSGTGRSITVVYNQ